MSDRLLTALRDLPVDWPETPPVRLRPLPGRRWRWVPSTIVAGMIVVLGFVGPVREAVAERLGIGVIRAVEVDRLPDDLGTNLDLGVRVESTDLAGPEALGDPDGMFVRDGEVSSTWVASEALPEVTESGVGAIFSRFDGALHPVVEKAIGPSSTLRVVTFRGSRAYWIDGEPHALQYLDGSGRAVEGRLAGNALIWQEAGFTYRFESVLGFDDVIALFEGWNDGDPTR